MASILFICLELVMWQGRSVTDIWGMDKPELIYMYNKNFKEVGGHEGGHGQKCVILIVKIKEFFSWG